MLIWRPKIRRLNPHVPVWVHTHMHGGAHMLYARAKLVVLDVVASFLFRIGMACADAHLWVAEQYAAEYSRMYWEGERE